MLNRKLALTCVVSAGALASQTALPAGLTEEGARNIAQVIQPSQAQLQIFTQPPTMARASQLSALTSPGLAATDAQKMLSMWHAFGLQLLAFDHTPAVDPTTGKQLHLQQFGPHRASYAMALLHLAMYEIANAFKAPPVQSSSWIERKLPRAVGIPPVNASEAVAIAASASSILNHLYVGDDYNISSEYDATLADLHSAPDNPGAAYGRKIASLILGLRSNDMSNLPEPIWGKDFSPKDPTGGAFQWEPDPISQIQVALGGNWGAVTPFVSNIPNFYILGNPNFPPPTHDLNDPAFISAYIEVRKCGVDQRTMNERRDCSVQGSLTNEDTYYRAKFWSYDGTSGICAPVRLYNQIADEVFAEDKASIVGLGASDVDVTAAEAKYYARINLALADAGIVAWYAKYFYQYWRPITGVRSLDAFNGSQSPSPKDRESWLPLGAQNTNSSRGFNITPPFPSYPSGHSVFGGAFFEILRSFVTKPAEQMFTFQSDEFNGKQALQPNVDVFNYVRCLDDPTPPSQQQAYCKARKFNFHLTDVANFGPENVNFDPDNAEGENSNSRIWMGVHWRFDGDNGVRLGRQIGDDVIANFP